MLGIRRYCGCSIDLFQGDLATFVCDGMVSPAFQGSHGSVVVQTTDSLSAPLVLHTTLPPWNEAEAGAALEQVVLSCLQEAEQRSLRHLAFAALGAGAENYPAQRTAEISLGAVKRYLTERTSSKKPQRLTFVLFDPGLYDTYQKALFALF